MSAVAGKRILLGVSGGIAAYKAIEVCRRLVDDKAHVIPVLTKGATRFVGVSTFDALASEPTRMSLFDDIHPIPHTSLGQTVDCVVVVPATARVVGAYACGISSDLLTATLLATRAPVVVCPAMHTEMWEHPAVVDNIATLVSRGVHIVGPESGRLAGGDEGAGRLAAPAAIVAEVASVLAGFDPPDKNGINQSGIGMSGVDMSGMSVVVTAGGTREPIDPVRFIGNRSSGKQGHAFAVEAASRGAAVSIITTGDDPVMKPIAGIKTPTSGTQLHSAAAGSVTVTRVDTAQEMAEATTAAAVGADMVIMAAAVADFRPVKPLNMKHKRRDGLPVIELELTPDILAELVAAKAPGQVLVGFAAETCDVASNGVSKLSSKGVDYIVANDVSAQDVGFDCDTNEVLVLSADGHTHQISMCSKREVAKAVLDIVLTNHQDVAHQDVAQLNQFKNSGNL
ncbi:MAG: bifunctional phosphopantothenoylcysteine decarboxylase/phosphopantothenate--cysteine ligase CoaBC [Acidimicrobiia bacterium]|nr:bifunctional phosphopantothenoylcysteine decarboxylase/phosphopantothenate--cysteine ligase CoaBC [Acidimicrobiia bacterium]MYC57357.1 bifunctional phosphopantothenoylcysteine decarboxylase/phosphopantothenate--cysteine ligase CoaBC [Acidimicrobiia bacterium]MYG94560.1 bifunctional phosphopantothenoylcysteine decarboxylase/phosphopantothenate--cysteine ligase CoaBC [Acidimicrobiia bacterium]MYI31157.1 bifunctional phosphopantothenoylcysteine decarboxylase/phosphopantothenate--cysteine ligase 